MALETAGVPQPGPRGRRTARDRLLFAAARRFYQGGVAATGIDTIIADAGVAKMSLYNNFSSKADLVRTYLEVRHQEWLELYQRRLDGAESPRDGVIAVFEAYADHAAHANEHRFRGCGLFNAAAELPTDDEGRIAVRRFKEEVEDLLVGHLKNLLPDRPDEARVAAEHLSFLLEGAMVRAGLEGEVARLMRACRMAADFMDRL